MKGMVIKMKRFRNYSIGENRLRAAYMQGMEQKGSQLCCTAGEQCCAAGNPCMVFFGEIDGTQMNQRWGRFTARIRLEAEMSYCIHFAASNERERFMEGQNHSVSDFLLDAHVSPERKQQFFALLAEQTFINQQDILLYELSGRYLWFYIEILGTGQMGQGTIEDMCIRLPGDNFMDAYPEVYQEWGSFFHRYLSIFSSMYQDFHREIQSVGKRLEVGTAPPEMLPELISWLGIDVSGNFLDVETLRTLAREGYQLNRKKGTKWSVARVAEIVLGEAVILVEDGFTITMLIRSYVEEKKKSQLLFLLKQFLPVRCRINIVYLERQCILNTYCYLNLNASLYASQTAVLDNRTRLQNHLMLG